MGSRPGEMRRCPTCGEDYGAEFPTCPVDGSRLGSAPRPPAVGRTLGERYLLKRRIGAGAFGVVFDAEDTRLKKRVAVKILAPRVAADPGVLARFEREARAAGRVGHVGIVDVTDFDRDDDGTHFMVMQYIDGPDLARVIRDEGPIDPTRALLIAIQIAEALDAAHRSGIVHRDLKPSNILLTDASGVGELAMILDFGISKVADRASDLETLTATGEVLGTPLYMAPEQMLGERKIDGRADIYALGVILFQMLTNRVPFAGPTHYAVIHKKLHEPPLRPSRVLPTRNIPDDIDAVVMRAIARPQASRFATATEFRAALLEALASFNPEAASLRRSDIRDRVSSPGVPEPMSADLVETEVLAKARKVRHAPASKHDSVEGAPAPEAVGLDARASEQRSAAAGHRDSLEPSSHASSRPRKAPAGRRLLLVGGVMAAGVAGAVGIWLSRAPSGIRAYADGWRAEAVEAAATAEQRQDVADAGVPEGPAPLARIRLIVRPRDARVELDGVRISDRELRFEPTEAMHVLEVSAPGYETATREFKVWGDGDLTVILKKKKRKKKRKPGSTHGPALPDDPV